jgi:general secretion pathway protein F
MAETADRLFLFQAMAPTGAKKLGLRAAATEAGLSEALKREQMLLLSAWRLPMGAGAARSVSLKDEASLNEQLEMLVSRGVPLVEALEVASTVVSPATRPRLERMRELVAAGASFSGACQQVGGLDDVTVSVYRSAERTGDLAGAAGRLAKAARRRLAISSKAITVMIYPVVVLGIASALFTALLVLVVPMLAEQIRQINPDINWFSQLVFTLGIWLRANFMLALLGVALVAFGLYTVRDRVIGALSVAGRRLPGVGKLMLAFELTRFFSVMASMTKSGVPLADALGTGVGVLSDKKLRDQLALLRQSLIDGGVLRTLIEKVDALPLATRRLLIAAERGGDLDSAFDALAADAANEVDTRAARLLALLEPLVIAGMFLLLAPLIIAVAVPMLTVNPNME